MKITSMKREDAPKKRQIDPKTLTKRSQIVRDSGYYSPVVRNGMTATETGFTKVGFSDAKFEITHEIMNAGSVSALVKHPTKTRTIHVISGPLIACIEEEDGSFKELRVEAGDQVVFEPNKAHKIVTIGKNPAEFLTVQHSKYDARKEVIESGFSSGRYGVVPREEESRSAIPRRSKSKASEQLANLRKSKGQDRVAHDVPKSKLNAPVAAVQGVNPRPTMGSIADEGAG